MGTRQTGPPPAREILVALAILGGIAGSLLLLTVLFHELR